MAADRPLTERGIIEIKMGRSKFPGKPSKIGNRKRVNLSSCALPEDNDSSKAAKNIYLGLSVFNETFGDNEMIAPKPFQGFSLGEVEEAMAEARLQQKEAEVEYKKQGININLWDCFQNELFSITSCLNYDKNVITKKEDHVNDAKLSFDGGGNSEKKETKTISSQENNDNQASNIVCSKSIILKNKTNKTSNNPVKRPLRTIMLRFPISKLTKSQHSPKTNKSLQSQAAKKLLEKAKMSNLSDSSKNLFSEKKFILPSRSVHSSRVIKPNKRFFEENMSKRKLLRSSGASEPVLNKKPKVFGNLVNGKISSENAIDKSLTEELKIDVSYEDGRKKKLDNFESKNGLDSPQNNLTPNIGKGILREARLQLDKSSVSLLEGPFSSPTASSLSPNSHVKVNLIQPATASGSIVCGVCGIVRFYRFVELAKKFGIHSCESCRKFISKIIKSSESEKESKLQCLKNNGLCLLNPVVKNQHFNINRTKNNVKCQACWLKLCVKNFKMPIKLKQKLLKLLPMNMQMSINLESSPLLSNDITNKFLLGNNNVKDFKWLYENSNSQEKLKDNNMEKQLNWLSTADSVTSTEKSLRKRTRNSGNESKSSFSTQNRKSKTEADDKNRQSVVLKGPRVKHVCRSASVVLGQPLATFPSETSPTKKLTNDDDCKNCDNLLTNNSVESQGNKFKSNKELSELRQGNKEKKLNSGKENSIPKSSVLQQNIANSKPKKKQIIKTENPISMDFWESYDPEEVCETGFGLIGSEIFTVRALCFLCGSLGHEKLIHCASCCEPYHEFCVDEGQLKLQNDIWKYNWVCPRCTICFTCGRTSGQQQLKCVKCDNSYHIECVDRVGGRLLHSPDRPWVCSACLRCKSCNAVDVSIFVGNLPLCKACFILRQKGNYCPLCQRCYEDDDYDSKMMECGQCKCWVHAKCEGLSDEKYQVLSFLPESVEYVCRMCCIMPPAPWWLAVEAELKSGYLGVLKALSKNRKACTMLKWSPRKQCTCRQLNFVSKALDFDDKKISKNANECSRNETDSINAPCKDKKVSNKETECKSKQEKYAPAAVTERKTSIEVISHPTESLKLTLKILKNTEVEDKEATENEVKEKNSIKENSIRIKKCPSNEENSEDSLTNLFDCQEDSQTSLLPLFKNRISSTEFQEKRSLSSPVIPSSDSGIGSTDDELKVSCLTDEESCKLDEQCSSNRTVETKLNCDNTVSFLEEKRECFCFLEVDSYNSRSKPFSPNLMSIKKKVTTSEYSSLHQFHQDMQRMIATTNSTDLMDLYHQTVKEIFPWFDPKYSRVQSNSQKVSEAVSLESTPVKSSPSKNFFQEECKIPKEKLCGQPLDYFYKDYVIDDTRYCLLCKTIGDGPPGDTGRLLYCGQNEWVHCNCALWSGEVFEEIDGSLQNVHSAISRGRSIKCPECNLKGASIGCCARNCQETYHFSCARKVGCIFMDDKTLYCPSHIKESIGKLVQNEKDFEIRRPVYVELDKRKMKSADSSQIHFAVGALQVENIGKFVMKLSDQQEAIIPEQFSCTRLFWSCYEPWRIVRYHFTVRLVEVQEEEGVDFGINLTVDHSKDPELVELKLKQLRYFQDHNLLLDISEEIFKEKRKLLEYKTQEGIGIIKSEENMKVTSVKRVKRDNKNKKSCDQFDPKFEENCLSDNQNTADLLPPDLEEAIFNDLPHDILDGISMQDIFMDIKNDTYENIQKEGVIEEASETEEASNSCPNKTRKNESLTSSQNEFWIEPNETRQDVTEEIFTVSKNTKEIKLNKSDGLINQVIKKANTLKTYQKSCGVNWNCKGDGNKWKKNSKCHVTVNLLDSQERGNMLQELKFTDGLVTISTGAIDSVQDLKAHLDENKCSMQQQEGKENKCLQWHTRLQPRLLQVDGNVDSSSSGSEAGESPQRLMDENINPKIVPPPQISPYLDSPKYSLSSPEYKATSYLPTTSNLSPTYSPSHSVFCNSSSHSLPQLDGIGEDNHSDNSDLEDEFVSVKKLHNKPKHKNLNQSNKEFGNITFKINQCDGSVDSDFEDEDSMKLGVINDKETPQTKEEPVKCSKCYCTYRTKMSYQRHLETCCNDFILSSSEGELSEEESPRKQCSNNFLNITTENNITTVKETLRDCNSSKESLSVSTLDKKSVNNALSLETLQSPQKDILEVKKEMTVKRTYTRKKSLSSAKKLPVENPAQVPQIVVQQSNNTPALVVQDVSPQNVVPTAFIESTPTLSFLPTIDSQNPFAKTQLIATPNGIISGNIQFPPAPQPQVIGNLCLSPQNINPNLSGFIIKQDQAGTLISQPGPLVMSSEQVVMGSTGLFDIIQDPRTGGMFLTNHSQPTFYNTETIVSNTVMQTNQFVSNFLATTYSQTSTQIFQTSEVEPVMSVPSGYIIVGPNPPTTNRILSAEDLICLQTPQTIIPNQPSIQIPNQNIFNPPIQATQTFNAEPKLMPTQINPLRCLQPIRVKPIFPSVVLNKVTNSTNTQIATPVTQRIRQPVPMPLVTHQSQQIKIKQTPTEKTSIPTHSRGVPMMRPDVPIVSKTGFEKAVITPKSTVQQVQPRSRALVDYINNFRSDICDNVPESTTPNSSELDKTVISSKSCETQRAACNNATEPAKSSMLISNPKTSSTTLVAKAPLKSYSENQSAPATAQMVSKKVESKKSLASIVPASAEMVKTAPVSSAPVIIPEIYTKPSLEVSTTQNNVSSERAVATDSVLPNVSETINLPLNSVDKIPTNKNLERCDQSKSVKSKPLFQEKKEKANISSNNIPPKISSNKTNAFTCEREVQPSLSMPELEDSPPSRLEEQFKTISNAPIPKEDEKLPSEILPLQENSQSINITKSPQQSSPDKNGNSVFDFVDEKVKLKKKISFDQNSPNHIRSQAQDHAFSKKQEKRKFVLTKKFEDKGPKLIFDVTSDDGFKNSSSSMLELWANICDSVQEMRAVLKIPPLPVSRKGHEILGMQNHGLQYCLEQLRGVEQCINYKCKYFAKEEAQKTDEDEVEVIKENLSGCARTEEFSGRKEYDMFAWLASRHRQLPKLTESAEEILSSIRRANNLPMAMKYRNLRETAKLYVAVYRSKIHGRGLFCLREIEAGEMVIEYAGEVIRSTLTDKREKYYTDKGIGCYMFRIDDHFVVDATMKGNAARFINHSCEPNCYSRVVDILGKKHIVIFALRRINVMEELTYDYKFPLEDEKISCHCLSKKCRKYLN